MVRFGEEFVVGSAVENNVDNVLVDKKTGETVCALDEVSLSTMADEAMMTKRKQVLGRNFGRVQTSDESESFQEARLEPGMTLKYGIELSGGKIKPAELRNLPVFLLSLNHARLEQGLKQFYNGPASSSYEEQLFKYFMTSLSAQIQDLKLDVDGYRRLPPKLIKRVESFQGFLKELGF